MLPNIYQSTGRPISEDKSPLIPLCKPQISQFMQRQKITEDHGKRCIGLLRHATRFTILFFTYASVRLHLRNRDQQLGHV